MRPRHRSGGGHPMDDFDGEVPVHRDVFAAGLSTSKSRHPDAIVQDTEQDPTPQKDDPHQDLFGIKIWTATMEIWIVRDIEM